MGHCFPAALQNQLGWGNFTGLELFGCFFFLFGFLGFFVGFGWFGGFFFKLVVSVVESNLFATKTVGHFLFLLKMGFGCGGVFLFVFFCDRIFHSVAPLQAFQ